MARPGASVRAARARAAASLPVLSTRLTRKTPPTRARSVRRRFRARPGHRWQMAPRAATRSSVGRGLARASASSTAFSMRPIQTTPPTRARSAHRRARARRGQCAPMGPHAAPRSSVGKVPAPASASSTVFSMRPGRPAQSAPARAANQPRRSRAGLPWLKVPPAARTIRAPRAPAPACQRTTRRSVRATKRPAAW